MEKNIGVSIKSFDTLFINWLLYSPKKALIGKTFCASVSPPKGQKGHICCFSFHRISGFIKIIEEIICVLCMIDAG